MISLEEQNARRRAHYATPEGREAARRSAVKQYAKRKTSGEPLLTEAQRAAQKAYRATPEGKAMIRASLLKARAEKKSYATRSAMTPEQRAVHRTANKAYRATPAGKAASAAQCARRAAAGSVSSVAIRAILEAPTCHYCVRPIEPMIGVKHHPRKATLDHVLPISRGGRTEESNLVAACWTCNVRKHEKTGEEYLATLRAV